MTFSPERRSPEVWLSPINVHSVEEGSYNLLIYCVGYEARSRYVSEKLQDRARTQISFVYGSRKFFSYDKNLSRTVGLGHRSYSAHLDVAKNINDCIAFAANQSQPIRLAIDISAMDRTLMAQIYFACLQMGKLWKTLDILYAPAEFRDPQTSFLPIAADMAVIPELAGRLRNPHTPLTMIAGLGFEYGVAQGIIERFEPQKLIAFRPIGTDARFGEAVRKANFNFAFDMPDVTTVSYEVRRPYELFYAMYDLVRGLSTYSEILIAPGGPKIFSMLSIIVGFKLSPDVCVWRVSLQQGMSHEDIVPDGDIYAVRVNSEPLQDITSSGATHRDSELTA